MYHSRVTPMTHLWSVKKSVVSLCSFLHFKSLISWWTLPFSEHCTYVQISVFFAMVCNLTSPLTLQHNGDHSSPTTVNRYYSTNMVLSLCSFLLVIFCDSYVLIFCFLFAACFLSSHLSMVNCFVERWAGFLF